jgi:putative ABC transport system permease protein
MTSLILQSLRYYWRTNLAVVLGVATAVSVLSGALLVGDSVRGSLRDLVVQRLGRTDRVVLSTGFVREALAADLQADQGFSGSFTGICPLIMMPGAVSDQETRRRSARVQVYGVDDRFWAFHGVSGVRGPAARDALLSRALAADIGASPGHTVVIRVERPSAIPVESLHGRKDNVGRTLRLNVQAIVSPADMGDFTLQAQQGDVRAIFVPLGRLQADLNVAGRVNALLVASPTLAAADELRRSKGVSAANLSEAERTTQLEAAIRRRFALEDVALTVRGSSDLIVESEAGLLDAPRSRAVEESAAASGLAPVTVFTYLANAMKSGDRVVPYSLVSALDLGLIAGGTWRPASAGPRDPIVVNDWTAKQLGVRVGDPLVLEYYVWQEPGQLVTRSADFQVAAVVPIAGLAADRDLAPVYPGITEAKSLANWDPPFPIDLRRIGRSDEEYWDRYRTTPKAFISLEAGQRLWQSRFGDRTSMRMASGSDVQDRFATALRARINPAEFGVVALPVREQGLRAARGATDFGEYFTYFSFFLVASALLLAALFFRLTVEQRARETGLLRAVGYGPARVRRLFLAEGFVLSCAGAVVGIAGAIGYGALMMAGLRTWWSGAVGTTSLTLHVTAASLAVGGAGAVIAAMVCIWWTLRKLSRISERSLLAGDVGRRGGPACPPRGRHTGRPLQLSAPDLTAVICAAMALGLLAAGVFSTLDRTAAFFGSGTLLLVACLCGVAVILRRPPRTALEGTGWRAVARIGLRNAGDRPGRSILAIGVIASATFLLVAVGAFRREAPAASDRHSGTGGYQLLVDLLLPLVNDPNSRDGHEALGLALGDPVRIDPFRVLPGDDASCLNLYEPTNPRVLGATQAFIRSGRFIFQSSLASTDAERANPWLLLNRDLGTGVVPVIADANSMTYVLHKGLGDELIVKTGDQQVRLRLVAALADSIFQRELVMADANFVRLYPEQEGYRFLLVDGEAPDLEQGAGDLGADVQNTAARLAEFHTVENTYLSTFQALGGLGLLVGTLGLTAVVLRNVLERRRELGLLGAVGYRRSDIFLIVIAENLLLVGWGLAIGTVCALVAIAPAAIERGGRLPVTAGGAMLLFAVFLAGLLSSVVATRAALSTPLLEALRSE